MRRFIVFLVLAFMLFTTAAMAQTQEVTLQPVPTASEDTILTPGGLHSLTFRFTNQGTTLHYNFNIGWRIFSPDGATWSYPARDTTIEVIVPGVIEDTTIDSVLMLDATFPNLFPTTLNIIYTNVDGADGDTIGVAGATDNAVTGLYPNYDADAYEVPVQTSAADEGRHICVDSSWFPPGGTWKWAEVSGGPQIAPAWSGQKCFLLSTGSDVTQIEKDGLPSSFALEQNYPNPFNPKTTILFDVPKRAHVKLTVFNVLGQEIVTLVDQEMAPGSYEADWDSRSSNGKTVASGIYFYKLESESFVSTKKMMLLK